jgi:hypothetical protein
MAESRGLAWAITPAESMGESDDIPDLVEVEDSVDGGSDRDDDDSESGITPSLQSEQPHDTPNIPQTPPANNARPTHMRRAPIPADDSRYFVTSYGSKNNKDSVSDAQANTVRSILNEPETYEEAMSRPDADHWKVACAEELSSFVKTGVYDEVERPKGQKVVDCKWVFRLKRNPEGEILRYKARLVAKGFTQIEGIDYNETFAPVAKFNSIRTILALVAELNLELHQMDVKTAFLNGNLEEEIYMNLPPGFRMPGVVWKLKRGLYGLKQASREWYKRLRTEFEKLNFCRLQTDHGIFMKLEGGARIIVAVYVDDLLILSASLEAMKALKENLKQRFEMTDLGEATWILGMEITRDRKNHTMSVSQRRYILDILERFRMAGCKSISTPMEQNITLTKLSTPEIDPKLFQSAVGSFMYAMIGSRPDLAFAVGALSQHCANPGNKHEIATKRVLRYLQGTASLGITYKRQGDTRVRGYVDADWGSDKND